MVTNWFLSFPFFLLALAIIAVYGPSANSVLSPSGSGLGLLRPAAARPGAVRFVRPSTSRLRVRRAPAACRMLHKHILPNSMAPLMVVATLSIARQHHRRGRALVPRCRRAADRRSPGATWPGIGESFVTFNPVEVLAPSADDRDHADRDDPVRKRAARRRRPEAEGLTSGHVAEPVLSVRNLKTYFPTRPAGAGGQRRDPSTLYPGETLGIVGESGSGKTVLSMSILGLIPEPSRRDSSAAR